MIKIKDTVYFIKNIKKIKEIIKEKYFKVFKDINFGDGCDVSKDAEIINKNNFNKNQIISIGERVIIAKRNRIINDAGIIKIGYDSRIGVGVEILSYGGNIDIGNNVVINDYSIIYGHGGVRIGDNTQIAAHCVFIPANHKFSRLDVPISMQGLVTKGINVESDVWIGANVVVLDGVTIGEGSIIGAGSVVTKSIPPFSIAVGNPSRVIKRRNDASLIDFKTIKYESIERISKSESIVKKKLIQNLLSYDSSNVDFLAEEERAFPGNKEYIESGYYKKMLARYLFAGSFFCKGKKVLDSCSGLGWGTYIISDYAKNIVAFDSEKLAIEFSKKTWGCKNTNWIQGDALDLSFLDNEFFDVALGMETIEHFTKEDGIKYVSEIAKKIKKGGFFIGTSAFPLLKDDAETLRLKNKFHLHIFTKDEMEKILKSNFSEYVIIDNWMFIAKK